MSNKGYLSECDRSTWNIEFTKIPKKNKSALITEMSGFGLVQV